MDSTLTRLVIYGFFKCSFSMRLTKTAKPSKTNGISIQDELLVGRALKYMGMYTT